MSESKEVAVRGAGEVSTEFKGMFDPKLGAGAGQDIDSDDILISKIHLAQALTPEVEKLKKFAAGVYMDSIEKTKIGDEIEVYVMNKTKLLQYYYLVKTKQKITREYIGTVPYTKEAYIRAGQDVLPEELAKRLEGKGIKTEGLELSADKVLRFFVVRTAEVAAGVAFPYIVDFKRTSYNAGQELETKFAKMRTVGLPSYARVFSLSSELIEGEFDYYVKKVSSGRDITADELGAVEHWVRELQDNADRYAADESDVMEETSVKNVTPDTEVKTEPNQPKF